MKRASVLLRLLLALCLALPSSCATSRGREADDSALLQPTEAVRVTLLPGERLQLDFPPTPPAPDWEQVSEEDVRALLADFLRCTEVLSDFSVVPAVASGLAVPAPWEARLRGEFLARYGPARLPLPSSLQRSPLYMALKLSPRYMGAGFRDAAQELFRSPLFIASVTLSILVYFAAWLMPEPIFSKSFAAMVTARLALAVGLLELRNVALAALQLYREAQAAKTMAEIEAVAERFGRALGGTALRVLVMVASFGVSKVLPNGPSGGLGSLLSPPRFAAGGGLMFQASTTAHVVSDGTIVLAGAALGTAGSAASSACDDGSQRKDGYRWHHLATDKNEKSALNGGPWTPLFERLFTTAGMALDDPENLVHLAAHQGPHPEEYHREIYQRLETALSDCRTVSQCRKRLINELRRIRSEVCTQGSFLHRLITKP
ncbi:AHH domain-containing protein [Hyalangium versicolor]|uniref:AHH domain-containing protein n=1 Tax=Hyalangium versicolor TaxID=2861190 RepID=UPI001CC9E9A6|nr:AHH domain-containing protein [Hyalangium versicolor]